MVLQPSELAPWQDGDHEFGHSLFFSFCLLTAGLPEPSPLAAFRCPCYFTSLVTLASFFFASLRCFFLSLFARIFLLVLVSHACGAHWEFAICSGVAAPLARVPTILNALIQRFSPKFCF